MSRNDPFQPSLVVSLEGIPSQPLSHSLSTSKTNKHACNGFREDQFGKEIPYAGSRFEFWEGQVCFFLENMFIMIEPSI